MAMLEQPPASVSEELREYLVRVNAQVGAETENSNQVPRLTRLPDKISSGKIYYFKNAIPTHAVITAPGFYGVIGVTWVIIAQ